MELSHCDRVILGPCRIVAMFLTQKLTSAERSGHNYISAFREFMDKDAGAARAMENSGYPADAGIGAEVNPILRPLHSLGTRLALKTDVYRVAGCTGDLGGDKANPLDTSKPFFGLTDPMTKFFDNAELFCTSTDPNLRTPCCGSADCVPLRCKKLRGVHPLPRCSVTADTCVKLTEWLHVPQGGPMDTSGNDAPCADVGRGASAVDGAYASQEKKAVPDAFDHAGSYWATPSGTKRRAVTSVNCTPRTASSRRSACTRAGTSAARCEASPSRT